MADRTGHGAHDPLLVAGSVDRGAVRVWLSDLCRPCAGLFSDLVALTAALPLAAVPARPRDYTLTVGDARRLRPGGWRAWWSTVGSARDLVTGPLAIGFTTLGLAGLLLTSVPTFVPMAASVPSSPEADRSVLSVTGGSAPSSAPVVDVPAAATGSIPPVVLWLGLLGAGGSLFAVRRVAARRRSMR